MTARLERMQEPTEPAPTVRALMEQTPEKLQ